MGRYAEAIPLADKSVRLDPSPINHSSYGYALIGSGQIEAGIEYVEKRLAQEPWFGFYNVALFRGYDLKGDFDKADKAVAAMAAIYKWPPGYTSVYQAYLLARRGKTQEARLALKPAEALGIPNWRLAVAWDAIGDNDRALDILEQSVGQRQVLEFAFGAAIISWKGPHEHPRFQAILSQVNLNKWYEAPRSGQHRQ
jgi:tetratricopeptide (TPR) repeat protein